jgi:hypothetical protein
MRLQDRIRYGIYLDTDKQTGGGTVDAQDQELNVPATTETADVSEAGTEQGQQQPPAAPAAPAAPAPTPGLTAEQVRELTKTATIEAIREHEAAQREAARQAQEAEIAAQVRRQQTTVDPSLGAADILEARQELMDEALDLHPEFTPDQRRAVREKLRNFRTIEQIEAARKEGLHHLVSHGIYGEAVSSGKIDPTAKRVEAPANVRTVHSEPVARSSQQSAEILELQELLGVKFSAEELKQFA